MSQESPETLPQHQVKTQLATATLATLHSHPITRCYRFIATTQTSWSATLKPEVARMVADKFQDVLQAAVERGVRLIPMDLPEGCAAAWVGGTASDCICYPENGPVPLEAMAHTVGHLYLLHCGRVRDGGRFACTDFNVTRPSVPPPRPPFLEPAPLAPLFSFDEERAADEAGATLLTKCGYWAEAYSLMQPASGHNFRCLG